jgi:hypothetical protein
MLLAADGERPLEERFELEAHLERCPRCRARREALGELGELLARSPAPALGSLDVGRALERIHQRLAEEPGSLPVERRSRPWRRAAAVAALLLALIGATAWWVLQTRGAGTSIPPAPEPDATTPVAAADAMPRIEAPPAAGPGESPPAPISYDQARARFRAVLSDGFAGSELGEDLEPRAQACDERVADLRREGWPIARLAETFLRDTDPRLAAAAARYLGLRGDRLAAGSIASAWREGVEPSALLAALVDLGESAVPVLATELDADVRFDAAVAALRAIGANAAPALEISIATRSARLAGELGPAERALLDALAATGPAAIAGFLRLAEAGVDAGELLARIDRVQGGSAELARLTASRDGRFSDETLLVFVGALHPLETLPWVEGLVRTYDLRGEVLSVLAEWDHPAAVRSHVRLALELTGARDLVVERFAEGLRRSPDSIVACATELLEARDAAGAGALLELMLEAETASAGQAFVELALSDVLAVDLRTWAALAIGELGSAREAGVLAERLSEIERSERRVFAAALVSIHVHLGPDGVRAALADGSERSVQRILTALSDTVARGSGAVGLQRVTRSIDAYLAELEPKNRREIP